MKKPGRRVVNIPLQALEGWAISEDGTTGLISFTGQNGERMMLTFPVDMIQAVASAGEGLGILAQRAQLPSGATPFRTPKKWSFGTTAEFPQSIVIQFDGEMPGESAFMFSKPDALRLSEAIKKHIIDTATGHSRRPLILPPGFQ